MLLQLFKHCATIDAAFSDYICDTFFGAPAPRLSLLFAVSKTTSISSYTEGDMSRDLAPSYSRKPRPEVVAASCTMQDYGFYAALAPATVR